MTSELTWTRVGSLSDLWEGEATAVEANGHDLLVVRLADIGVRAYQGMCPHQEQRLIDGMVDGGILMCAGHLWEFDLATGQGVNPRDCALASYPVRIEGEDIYVTTDGIQPLHSY